MVKEITKIISFSFESLTDALDVARSSCDDDSVIELASPLIKSEGLRAITAFRKSFPENTLIADLKTMDTGSLEVAIACDAGADIVTVSSLTSRNTILGAISEAGKRGKSVMIDLFEGSPAHEAFTALGAAYLRHMDAGARNMSGIISPSMVITLAGTPELPSPRTSAPEKEYTYPKLQVALDLVDLTRAQSIASAATDAGASWIEAGTPLIKYFGMDAVRALRNNHPESIIIADLKTLNDPRREIMIAARAGADIIGICGISSDDVIRDAVGTAKELGVRIMADLISAKDPVARAKELESLGVDYLEFHVSVDEQQADLKIPFDIVESVTRSVSIPVAVAGGMNPETARHAIDAGAKIAVVGGHITRSADPESAAKEVLDSISDLCKNKEKGM